MIQAIESRFKKYIFDIKDYQILEKIGGGGFGSV